MKPFHLDYLNIIEQSTFVNKIPLIDEKYMCNVEATPRTLLLPPPDFSDIVWRKVWLFRKSNFSEWVIEDDDFAAECFEFDW
jgi:hypothetical protein